MQSLWSEKSSIHGHINKLHQDISTIFSRLNPWKTKEIKYPDKSSYHVLREYHTVGIANWFFHENSWCGQFRHALSKYAMKNIPSWLSFRDIYDRISTNF